MPTSVDHTQSFKDAVFPIVISTPFAVGDVFSYLLKDEKVVLVDCGHNSDSAYAAVRDGLRNQGLEIAHIDEIWLTHGHPDHFGQAARLADESGAVVKGHAGERANFAGNYDRSLFRDFFEQHHIPSARINEMVYQLDHLQRYQQPVEPEWISENDLLQTGKWTFCVQHTPGHAPGHVVFHNDEGLTFGGDVLLEHISTNALINFDRDTGERNKSLLQYRQSLQWMRSRNGLLLPGHGKQIHDIGGVAQNHLAAQEDRYEKIIKMLEQKPYTLFQLSGALFPDALQHGEYFLVLSEVIGYLDWGLSEGVIEKDHSGKAPVYSVEPNA